MQKGPGMNDWKPWTLAAFLVSIAMFFILRHEKHLHGDEEGNQEQEEPSTITNGGGCNLRSSMHLRTRSHSQEMTTTTTTMMTKCMDDDEITEATEEPSLTF